ncbi:MAG TPA: type II secretion system F family protein [Rhodocyclaceae bacterium]|nr:type II secretion system F family protein [Rhodocyclaceae bacterium]
MPNFRLRTYRAGEGFNSTVIAASTQSEAVLLAEQNGQRVVEVHSEGVHGGLSLPWQRDKFSLELFSQELVTLLGAGLTLVEALDALAARPRDEASHKVLNQLRRLIDEGKPLSVALESLPDAFPVLYVATLRSSERTGNLPEALKRYLAYHRQINLVRNKVVAASIYPLILIGISVLLMSFLLGFVIPRFARIYSDMGDRLPFSSRMIVAWSHLLEAHGIWILIVMLASLALFALVLLQANTRGAIVKRLWELPGVGERMKTYQLARFTRTLAMLLGGGIPFVPALGMVVDLLRQPALKSGLAMATRSISEGMVVSDVFARCGLANEIGVRMLAVAERTGDLPSMLEQIANMSDQELERSVDWLSRLLEPILMVSVGLVIGVVVVLMYLPIFELANLTK